MASRSPAAPAAEEAGPYIAKTQDGGAVGNEMARADLKQGRDGHRTPFEILDDFRWTGDLEDLALWHEYERATKGQQAITWSKGLRQMLAVEPSAPTRRSPPKRSAVRTWPSSTPTTGGRLSGYRA